MDIILDCGHTSTPTTGCGTGYGTDNKGKTACYECCAIHDKNRMRETGRITLYLCDKEVTNWPGTLHFPIRHTRESRHNWGLIRRDFWFTCAGESWHGYQIGENTQIAHCQRVKS